MEVKKRSKWFKTLAAFLAFVMVIQILPFSVLADEIKNAPEEFVSEEQNFDIADEVVAERTEYKKVYELSDGTFYEISSAAPIHENSGGEWVEPEIDADEPETTIEAVEYCNTMAESISENQNIQNGISPASIDIVDPTEPVLSKTIVSSTSRDLSKLTYPNVLLVKTPEIVANASTLNQATISCQIKITYQNHTSGYVYAYQINKPWDINSETLVKNDATYYPGILDVQNITSSGYNYWDITDTYLNWEKGIFENYGIAFSAKARCSFTIEQCCMVRQYKTIESYDTDFTYHSVDMGRAGTVYFNDFTNTVLIKRNELGIDGNILPVELIRYIDLNGNSSVGNPYGKNTRYNYESGIRKITSFNYAWDSFDGETIYFTPSYFDPNGSYIDWKDTNGYGYELRIKAAGINGNDFSQTVLKDDETTYSFNKTGKIVKIAKNDDEIEIVYTKNKTVKIGNKEYNIPDGLIDYVKDGNGRMYCFNYNPVKEYNSAKKTVLESIEIKVQENGTYNTLQLDNENLILNYEYTLLPDGNIGLSKVIYPDGEYASYVYNENGYLTEIVDTDGRRLRLEYEGNVRLYSDFEKYDEKKVDFYPSITAYYEEVKNIDDDVIITDKNNPDYNEYLVKSSLNIDRHNSYQRTFADHTGKTELIQYNPNLKIIYYRTNTGEEYYADYSKTYNNKLTQILSPENNTTLLENDDFEIRIVDPWFEEGGNSLKIKEGTLSGNGEYILRVEGSTDNERAAIQDVKIDGMEGDTFVIGGWGRGNAPIPVDSHFFGIEVYAAANAGTEEEPEIYADDEPLYKLEFDTSLDYEEQFRLGAFQLEENTEYIEVRLVYSYQSGAADFDEIQLYKSSEESVSFFDDSNSETDMALSADESDDTGSKSIYNEKGLPITEIISNGNLSMVSQYEYNNNYYLKSATDNNNVKTEYEYDNANGTLKSLKIGDKKTVYSYTPVGALKEVSRAVSGLTDGVDKLTTSYSYSHDRITSITHNGIKYNLTYNSFGNVKKVDLEVLSGSDNKNNLIIYDYSKDYKQNLNSITYANGDVLSYAYDENNNITEIYFKLHSETDSELMYKYEYADNNLSKITDYDSNRITEYTSDGYEIYRFNPSGSDEEPILLYSVSSVYNENDGTTINKESLFGSEYTYTRNEESVNTNNDETTYSSKYQFTLDKYKINMESSSVSDYFGRAKSSRMTVSSPELNSEINADASIMIDSTYTYENYNTAYIDNNEQISIPATTNLIKSYETKIITQLKDENGDLLEVDQDIPSNTFISSYKYDNCGRITHVYYSQNNSDEQLISYYKYDESGQVIIDIDFISSVATEYSYDSGGNITSKKIYSGEEAFSFNNDNVSFATPTETINYGYGNSENSILSGFSDLLTSYNDCSITYDELGNPLNYYGNDLGNEDTNYQLEWQGTLLKSATTSDEDTKYVYSYDQNGLRTKKSTYSRSGDIWTFKNEIEYIWDNDLLIGYSINNGDITIKMLYDEYQSPIGVTFISDEPLSEDSSDLLSSSYNVFWFVKDGQGNIIGMYSNIDGKSLGCHYDSYGKITLDMNGTFMDEIADEIDNAVSKYGKWAPIVIALLVIGAAGALATLLTIDQMAYRGQLFDYETGLYYCQNRYYSPVWGRFISMDDPAQLTLNLEEPLNANLYAYCYNDPVNNVDPNGRSSYSFTGVGMQAEMSACLLSFAGEVGIELIYTWTKNALYAYYYYGGGAGAGYTNKAINYLSSSFKDIAMSPKVSLKNIANLFKLNYSISIGFFAAFTNKSFSWPNSYAGLTNSSCVSVGKWKGYRSTSSGCKTYGICYSPVGNLGFAFSKTTARYKKINFSNSKVLNYLKGQKNNIKSAVN